jgi:8-oxo-dGTP diphosphatase
MRHSRVDNRIMTSPSSPLKADTHLPRQGQDAQGQRKVTQVAVGVLIRADDQFLMTSRPASKVYAGYWEFPGGKIEPGETLEAALRRELQEEIGITIGAVHPWREQVVDYPHALVCLKFCKVFEWSGQFEMREGQQMQWQSLPTSVEPILPGAIPLLGWLQEERALVK